MHCFSTFTADSFTSTATTSTMIHWTSTKCAPTIPTLEFEKWAGEPLAAILDRRMAEFVTDSSRTDPDPDVITAEGTSDLPAIVALAEQRRNLVKILEADSNP